MQSKFVVLSNSFKNNENLSKKYTAYADNISPHLKWSNAPAGAKSFALICDDPDAKPICGFAFIHVSLFSPPQALERAKALNRGPTPFLFTFFAPCSLLRPRFSSSSGLCSSPVCSTHSENNAQHL